MSATTHKPVAVATREAEPSLLEQILDQVQTISHQQSRPSPIHLRSWEEIERFAEKAARSGMVPKDYVGKTDAIVIAVMMGSELGLPPMQALQNIAVVNGRPSIWGDAMPALCRASGLSRSIREWSAGDGDDLTYYCEAIRKDDPNPIISKFSVADAKRASLWKETPKTKKQGRDGPYEVDSGPWYSYPKRMLQMRARGFCLRDAFPDVLRGLISAEEAADIPFEATGLTIRPDPEQIMQPAPQPPKKTRTWGDFLDELDLELASAKTVKEVDDILARQTVQTAQDKLQNGARDRLQGMIDAAIKRTAEPPQSDEPAWDDDTDEAANHDALLAATLEMVQHIAARNRETHPALIASGKYSRLVDELTKADRIDLMNRLRDANSAAIAREAV